MEADNSQNFGHDTTTDEVLEGVDLSGKTALITGASAGLGAETARALAAHGADVIITARTKAKGQPVADRVNAEVGRQAIRVEELELGDKENIQAFAKRILETTPKINILINNAGVMACPFEKTKDGFELQFGTNHLGHFLVTCLIAPALIQGAPSRVVSLSSRGHLIAPVDFEDPNYEHNPYNKWIAYGQAKTANALFAVGLNKRLAPQNVRAYSVHPGIIETDLSRHMDDDDRKFLFNSSDESRPPTRFKTIPAGAATSVYAATAPELEDKGGAYLENCGVAPVCDEAGATVGVRSYAVSEDNAEKLWALSEKLLGVSFTFS